MVAGGPRHGAKASSSRVGPLPRARSVSTRHPHFADAQEEQQLWEELHDHDTSLNRVLNEALRIHGGPAWRVFQVRRRSLACCFLLCSVVFAFVFAARC
jgi:hypothetical protein